MDRYLTDDELKYRRTRVALGTSELVYFTGIKKLRDGYKLCIDYMYVAVIMWKNVCSSISSSFK